MAGRLEARAIAAEESGRNPEPLRLPMPLGRLPWDVLQDEMGVKATDFIGEFGKVIVSAAKDEIATQLADFTEEFRKVRHRAAEDP